jgi:hypothetical protein
VEIPPAMEVVPRVGLPLAHVVGRSLLLHVADAPWMEPMSPRWSRHRLPPPPTPVALMEPARGSGRRGRRATHH